MWELYQFYWYKKSTDAHHNIPSNQQSLRITRLFVYYTGTSCANPKNCVLKIVCCGEEYFFNLAIRSIQIRNQKSIDFFKVEKNPLENQWVRHVWYYNSFFLYEHQVSAIWSTSYSSLSTRRFSSASFLYIS